MKHVSLFKLGFLFLILSACQPSEKQAEQEEAVEGEVQIPAIQEISFLTPDSITIIGDFHHVDKEANTILLFHQAGGDARGEYETIIPKLVEAGFNVAAIDQRVGGDRFGGTNRTMANIDPNNYAYCDAYPDLNSALDYVIDAGYTGNKIIWGSSYSAALVVQLGNNRPDDIAGVLAFSPASGPAMGGCDPNQYFETISIPLMVLRPDREMENESVKKQFELAQQLEHKTHISENGVHGSSMLVSERTEADMTKTWIAVMEFLGNFID